MYIDIIHVCICNNIVVLLTVQSEAELCRNASPYISAVYVTDMKVYRCMVKAYRCMVKVKVYWCMVKVMLIC